MFTLLTITLMSLGFAWLIRIYYFRRKTPSVHRKQVDEWVKQQIREAEMRIAMRLPKAED